MSADGAKVTYVGYGDDLFNLSILTALRAAELGGIRHGLLDGACVYGNNQFWVYLQESAPERQHPVRLRQKRPRRVCVYPPHAAIISINVAAASFPGFQ
jgi:hypothetical protein|tara:strand:+ start:245 stop:541 length:297 start_codon:yes stop_codon:yes gene_type:complete